MDCQLTDPDSSSRRMTGVRCTLLIVIAVAIAGCEREDQWIWEFRGQGYTAEQKDKQQQLLKTLPGYPTGFRRQLPGESIDPHRELLELADSVGTKSSTDSVWFEFEIPNSGDDSSSTTLAIRVECDVVREVVFEPAQY